MKIHKALKVKNRIIGEIARLRALFRRENSRRNDNPSTVDVGNIVLDLLDQEHQLIKIKTGIAIATAPISEKLVELAYLKDKINFMHGIPTKKGEELTCIGRSENTTRYEWIAYMDQEKLDENIQLIQNRINQLQDEIDEYNAVTDVGL